MELLALGEAFLQPLSSHQHLRLIDTSNTDVERVGAPSHQRICHSWFLFPLPLTFMNWIGATIFSKTCLRDCNVFSFMDWGIAYNVSVLFEHVVLKIRY